MWRTAFLALIITHALAFLPTASTAAEPPGPTSMKAVPVPTVEAQPLAPPTPQVKAAPPSPAKSRLTNWLLILAATIFAAAGYRQWKNHRPGRLTKKPAHIRVKGYNLSLIGRTDAETWGIDFLLENTGDLPARKLATSITWKSYPAEIPHDLPTDTPDKTANFTTATPGQVIKASSNDIPLATLVNVSQKQQRLMAWGWAEYETTPKTGPRQRMEFCYEINLDQDFTQRGRKAISVTPCRKQDGMGRTSLS